MDGTLESWKRCGRRGGIGAARFDARVCAHCWQDPICPSASIPKQAAVVSCQVPGGVVDHEGDAGQGDQLSVCTDLQRVGTPSPSPPCLWLCRAHAQVLNSVAAGALVPAVKPRWCCRGLLLLNDDGGDWRRTAGSPLDNVVCPAWLIGSVPGAHAELQICPDRAHEPWKMLVWADGTLVGAVAVCSLPWSVSRYCVCSP